MRRVQVAAVTMQMWLYTYVQYDLFFFSISVPVRMWYDMYSVFTINVPLAVRFATISIGTRKAESPEYGRFDRDLQ